MPDSDALTALAVARRLRTPVPWRSLVTRLYSQLVIASIIGLVGYGWAYAGLTKAPQAGSGWSALWLSVLGATVLMKVALAFGPVFAGADRMFWVLSSPVPRGVLLRPRFFGLLGAGAAVGAAWPAAVFGIVGAVVPPLAAVVVGAAVGVAVVAGASVAQRVRVRPQGWLSGLVGLAVVALLVPLGWRAVPVEQAGAGGTVGEMSWFGGSAGVVLAAWVVAVGLSVVAGVGVRHLRRVDLAAGGALAGVAKVSVSWFDLALLGAILGERRARTLGRVKSARLGVRGARGGETGGGETGGGAGGVGSGGFQPSLVQPGGPQPGGSQSGGSQSGWDAQAGQVQTGHVRPGLVAPGHVRPDHVRPSHVRPGKPSLPSRVAALAWIDALRLRRTPNAALVWVALLPAPALVALGGEPGFAPAAHVVAAFLATDRLAAGLKFVCRSPAMRRALGLPDRTLRLAHLVFPAAGAVLWCAITTAFTPDVSVLNGLVSAVGAVAVVYRIATRPPVDYGAAIIDFGLYGPTPLGLIVQFSRGPALLAVLALVQMAL